LEIVDYLENSLNEQGYEYEKLAEDVFLVKNFLTPEEIKEFDDLARGTLPPQWYFFYLKELEKKGQEFYGRTDIASLIEEGKLMLIPRNMTQTRSTQPELEETVDRITDRVNKILPEDHPSTKYGVMQRHYKGVGLEDHRDTDCNPSLKLATVVYINDDYEGGYLYFKDEDFTTELRPPAGSIMIFRASRLHGVTEVTGPDERYVLTSFISHVSKAGERFDTGANQENPTDGQDMGYKMETREPGYDPALNHFLEKGYAGTGKKGTA
jgi:Rps23 Pro-64 3,4-dihydroxylase Tpa1-like proline 4-hydroxylase